MRLGLRWAAWLAVTSVAIYLFYWIVVGILATAHRYQPEEATLDIEGDCISAKWPEKLSVMTWNLGYGGIGAEGDFFLDGGHNILAPGRDSVLRHLGSITTFLQKHPADVALLEEVDSDSRRSYSVDERRALTVSMQGSCSSYALNHDVYFIPYPKLRPLGRVRSGMLAL